MTIQNGINANTVTPLPIAGGGTGVNALPTTAAASRFAAWDANVNISANNVLLGYATTVTAAGTTTLTVSSACQQFFTGTSAQTVVMPVTSTLVLGQYYRIINNSTAAIAVNSSGGNLIVSMSPNTEAIVTCILTSGTTAASWAISYIQSGYFNYINPVNYASAAANLNATYNNGASGIGATLTNAGALAAFAVDGASPTLGQRILVQAQSTPAQNGIYSLTVVGDGATPWVLTRTTDFDTPQEIQPGDFVTVQAGTQYANSSWLQTATVTTVGTDSIIFSLFGVSINNVVTLDGNQTITGQKTFNATTAVTGTFNVTGQLNADNLRLDGNTFSSTDTNGNIIINPNGTGIVQLNSANTSAPLQINSGTTLQHVTNLIIPNTAATRNTTLQDADGTVAYLENIGYRFILTQSAGNVASSVFNNLTGYSNYYFILTSILPVTNGAQLLMQYSTDNGSTWRSTSGDYVQQAISATSTTLATTITATATAAALNINQSNAVAPFYGNALLIGANLALLKSVQMRGFNYSSAAVPISYQSECYFTLAAVVNAVRFIYSAGNINIGAFTMYGMLS
jgi:hypothetical protein